MFKIESYVTPILLSYVDKYVRDFKPADAQVSLWGGGVALHNLVLKADVLQQEVALPFTLVSGRIHELLIQVPWTKIMSEPIVVTIDTIECVLSLNPPASSDDTPPASSPSRNGQVVEAPPGYMQALVRRIVSNIALRVHHLIVKYVQDDIVLSLNVKHLAVDSAGANWEPTFADIDQIHPLIRRLVRLDDLTLCLDKSDADGKIRFFQEPLLYRCQLHLRVLTRLLSANTRRATSLDVQLRSGKLAWSVSNEQLVLLLRLLKERPVTSKAPAPPRQTVSPAPLHTLSANSAEPTRSESWTEWAWSWLPSLADREVGAQEAPAPATPLPVSFNAYLDDVSLVFKVMEVKGANRKRPRPVLEVCAAYAALKSSVCSPTLQRVRLGARELIVRSQGKCVCGYVNYKSSMSLPTVFLQKVPASETETSEEAPWSWPEELLNEKVVETAVAVDEDYSATPTVQSPGQSMVSEGDAGQSTAEKTSSEKLKPDNPDRDEVDEFWANMAPLVYVDYTHERSAPNPMTNPYDNPPKDFEYSDWVEECTMSIVVEPVKLRVCMGLIHRLMALRNIYKEEAPQAPDLPKRTLTVEENESLNENLPQRRIKLEVKLLRVRLNPWDHSLSERPMPEVVVLEVELPNSSAIVTSPMYPHRVCSAACQLPSDSGSLWECARRHISVKSKALQVRLANSDGSESRPCARADINLLTHELLHKDFFENRNSVEFAYHFKIKEMSICGSSARLQAALEVPVTLLTQQRSLALQHTTLPKDALNDEDSVAIDISLEDYGMRGYVTDNVNTHLATIRSAKVTALHEPKNGEIRQAWLLSAPDEPTTTPYIRLAVQWCTEPIETSFDYCGLWAEPLAMSVDPLLISWLAYKPTLKPGSYHLPVLQTRLSQASLQRRSTPPSSSGRGGSRTSGAGAELVHLRSRSIGSSSEPSEKKEVKIHPLPKQQNPRETWLSAEWLTALHHRLRSMLLNVELGQALLYVTMSSASAIDCATLRDAMERHAAGSHSVLAICLGRLSMQSNLVTKRLWEVLRHDGPTFVKQKLTEDSFPWKIRLADVSCYILEVRAAFVPGVSHLLETEQTGASARLKSKLSMSKVATPRIVLELVTTTITVSVLTKSLQFKEIARKEPEAKKERGPAQDRKTKYFTSGKDFKPTTLTEFVRGPSARINESPEKPPSPRPQQQTIEEVIIKKGPMVSLGVHLHADTPPIVLRLDQDQVIIVDSAIHCFTHIVTLLNRPLMAPSKADLSSTSLGGSNRSQIRSVSEMEEIPSASEDTSENHSELLTIFDRSIQFQHELKTFFWFQWVVSHVTLVVASETVKLALEIDDVIGTVDIQTEYNQLKIKLASASIKHFKRNLADEWTAGVIGGRVLEAREPSNAQEDAHFLSVTITQAQISDLPANWKEELHPKLLEKSFGVDYMWEVFATLAPLEAVVQPNIVDSLMTLVREMAPRASCPLTDEIAVSAPDWQWPYVYLNAGGIRLLVIGEQAEEDTGSDDTFIFSVGKVAINPHPDNPVCRRAVSAGPEAGWPGTAGGFDGRQYEFIVKSVSIQSSRFKKITVAEAAVAESKKNMGTENPALKWSQRSEMPQMVPILHSVELSCIFAPALYLGGVLTCGPAVELNLVSDCSFEFSIEQYLLLRQLSADFLEAMAEPSLYQTIGAKPVPFNKHGVCPYAMFIQPEMNQHSDTTLVETITDDTNLDGGPMASDSGVETVASSFRTKLTDDLPTRKSVSVAFVETGDASQFLEVFVTMGVIELSLYVADDGSPEVVALRPPATDVVDPSEPAPAPVETMESLRQKHSVNTRKKEKAETDSASTRSLNELRRNEDQGHTNLDLRAKVQIEGSVPLLQVTLFQPNVYYWRRKTQKTLQLSLFDAWVAVGSGAEKQWHAVLLSTAKGVPDPVTEIPPALATFKLVTPFNSGSGTSSLSARGYMRLDIERPVRLNVSTDKLLRISGIIFLLKRNITRPDTWTREPHKPVLYELKNKLINEGVENITIHTSQISVCGREGVLGWDSLSLQVCTNARPERVHGRALITALLLTAGPPGDTRHVVLQPLMVGMEGEAFWEAWRRAEGGLCAREPTLKISVELDDVTMDLRPSELLALNRLRSGYKELLEKRTPVTSHRDISSAMYKKEQIVAIAKQLPLRILETESSQQKLQQPSEQPSSLFEAEIDDSDHFYKDDLRSGAFKILSGGQLPMAYQVMLSGNAVSWRYPHPRAITRVVAFPLPGQNKEIDCVLELHNSMLDHWEPHTYFKLPVGEPRELQLFVTPPETVFAVLWRFRVCEDPEPVPPPYEFVMKKFLPKQDPSVTEEPQELHQLKASSQVTAEQLSGVLRVDSYFAPRLLPRASVVVRVATLHVHLHNSLPTFTSSATYIEGYYVSKPLVRTHRVLTLAARCTAAHALVASPAGKLLALDTKLSCDMVDCSTGTMEEIIEEFRLQSGMSAKDSLLTARHRVITTGIHMSMEVTKLQTLHYLVTDWNIAYDEYIREPPLKYETKEFDTTNKSTREVAKAVAHALEGRVSLWIHNSCSSAIRLGQEDTDEVVPLGSGGRLAYRWRYPTAQKRLRFALADPSTEWKWTSSIPFVAGTHRLRIETQDTEDGKQYPMGSFLHVKIEEKGASRYMHVSGKLVLANMLRATLLYKIRCRGLDSLQWYTVSSGLIDAETVGRSVVCSAECEMVLKIKFRSQNTCWSGDIPLKECPKQNVPWLVKVPTEGDSQFISVWCRVVRGRSDGRILATTWPLYVLHSHLPLDTDVLIATEPQSTSEELLTPQPSKPPVLQTTPGRGTSTHLLAPGTTSARHSLSFQYRNLECPVTREVIPMHYGVTDTSVFDKRSPVMNITDVIKDIRKWLERSGRHATTSWPYSVVHKHWQSEWQPATLQPRCDVTIRYTAVRAGGGCSLEVQLCPVVMLCNASPVSMTLRSYDAAPLCKLQPGTTISPPSAIIQKPFFMSIELGRETFVSTRLQVSTEEPGRYGTLPPGHVALDHATNFAIQCNEKVALLTMYYEIKEQINVLGVSSSYVLINRLDTDILVSAVGVPDEVDEWITLRPKTFAVVPPTKDASSASGTPMCNFWLRGRWRGGDPAELRVYLCLALPASSYPSRLAVPIQLGQPPFRKAVGLIDSENKSIPIVVTQMKQDGRWLVVVAPDPCPQFVVQNHTRLLLAVAQPIHPPDEASASNTEAKAECAGIKWWCTVPPNTAVHYSTPAHCARFPPDAMPHVSMASPILTVAKGKDETQLEWCAPVVAADGEQLLQYFGGLTIKLRVRTYPHSTLLELQNVDQNDISASDIRRRLQGFLSENNECVQPETVHGSCNLERTQSATELLLQSDATLTQSTQDSTEQSSRKKPDTTSASVGEEMPPEKNKIKDTLISEVYARADTASTVLKSESSANRFTSETSFHGVYIDPDLEDLDDSWVDSERFRCVIAGVAVELGAAADVTPLLALHLDRTALLVTADNKITKTMLSIADVQIDNLQYESGQYDFAVVASTRAAPLEADRWPPLWNMFAERETFAARSSSARLLLKLTHDKWEVVNNKYNELTELEVRVGTLALYVEDAYVKALVELSRLVVPSNGRDTSLSEERSMQCPLRLRLLHVHPLDLTLTLHTAVRMYIALDQSPLRLSAFKLHDMMTSAERLTHALTVHYLSAAILGAGWVVGGLELLGAPGALAARLGGATGGVRGVASAAAAALLRSLSAWAGSLARNLDLLAGDEEHAQRAAAARRRPPPSFVAGLVAGITNFAINILGAVGGLAHHPLVGVAVGETESGAAALRRGLLGALTKPLSATADLVAYAGSGLLRQTGWDPVPEPRCLRPAIEARTSAGWHRDCVRWVFRLCELSALAGYEVLLDHAHLQILLTHKFLVIAEPESERIVEMIDFRHCSLSPYEGEIIELVVMQRSLAKVLETRLVDEDDEYQVSAAAMARVARYTGAEESAGSGAQAQARVLSLLPRPGRSYALHSALCAALHNNSDTHFPML